MKRGAVLMVLAAAILVLGSLVAGLPGRPARGLQLAPEDLADQAKWEEFLKTAEIVEQEQILGSLAVTNPWILTLQKGDLTHRALWKNAQGRMHGYWEGWQYEIAAFLLDRHIGLNMVPVTIERRFQGDRGSCQIWVEDCISLREKDERKVKVPPIKIFTYNRATFLQRFWDNLIANEDRHQNQVLLTKDWRMILIDHSRSFRSSKKFTKELIYTEKHKEGPKLMSELPRAIVEKIKALTAESIKAVVGEYLTDEEIGAVLLRRDLILAEVDRLIAKDGEAKVLY